MRVLSTLTAAALLTLSLSAVQAAEPLRLTTTQLDGVTAGAQARNIFSSQGANSAGGSTSSSISTNGSGFNISQQQSNNNGGSTSQTASCTPNCTASIDNGQATVTNPPPPPIRPRFNLLSLFLGRL